MKKELTHLKMTLLLIKDWDSFQLAMRELMVHAGQNKNSAYGGCR